jgi:hypothetical protein
MALFFPGKTLCSICGVVVESDEKYHATTHFIGDDRDPLWRFSDSVMHEHCFLAWPLRQTFVDRYNATVGKITAGNGNYQRMETDGSISVLKRDVEH